jgi:hypothetical protein
MPQRVGDDEVPWLFGGRTDRRDGARLANVGAVVAEDLAESAETCARPVPSSPRRRWYPISLGSQHLRASGAAGVVSADKARFRGLGTRFTGH